MDSNNFDSFLRCVEEIINNSPISKIKDSIDVNKLAQVLIGIFEPYRELSEKFNASFESYLPALERISEISNKYGAIVKLGRNQYVLRMPVSKEFVEEVNKTNDRETIDAAIESHIEHTNTVKETIEQIKREIGSNEFFEQAVCAFYRNEYSLAILGFVSVLDRMLSKCSEQILNVRIGSRVKAILQKVEQKGDLYIDELEEKDYALLLTYKDALDSFGKDSKFLEDEPKELNRHWIMHGRSNRVYSRLDCIKIINMIYGTIRMSELGLEDREENR